MHYFTKHDVSSTLTATCEADSHCAGLVERGYAECGVEVWRAARRENDRRRRVESRTEDERAMLAADQARIVGRTPGVVYPSMVGRNE